MVKFVLYNGENFDIVDVNSGVRLEEDKINEIQDLHTDKMIMEQAGFLEVYLDNQAQTPVYFDNLMVIQSTGNVTEVNAYYPSGMIIGPLSFDAAKEKYNAYKYNAKELQKELNLKWLDYGNRMMDPIVGRFWVPDRFAEKYYHLSPYSYGGLNPINYIDINGDSLWIAGTLYTQGMIYEGNNKFVGMIVNYLNTISQGDFGKSMISELQGSKHNFKIRETEGGEDTGFKADDLYHSGQSISTSGEKRKGSGGVISIDTNGNTAGTDENGNAATEMYIIVGHELGHGLDAKRGQLKDGYLEDNKFPGIPVRERSACHYENILRSENGLPLRKTYFKDSSEPVLIDNSGKRIENGYDYRSLHPKKH